MPEGGTLRDGHLRHRTELDGADGPHPGPYIRRQTLDREGQAAKRYLLPLKSYCSSIIGCSRRALSQLRSFCSA
jgi:hypothetical protein